jgi:hypothetical protein
LVIYISVELFKRRFVHKLSACNILIRRQQYVFIIIIVIFLHGLGRLTCSGIDAFPSFPGASAFPSSSRFVVEGVFRESGVVHSLRWLIQFCLYLSLTPCLTGYTRLDKIRSEVIRKELEISLTACPAWEALPGTGSSRRHSP